MVGRARQSRNGPEGLETIRQPGARNFATDGWKWSARWSQVLEIFFYALWPADACGTCALGRQSWLWDIFLSVVREVNLGSKLISFGRLGSGTSIPMALGRFGCTLNEGPETWYKGASWSSLLAGPTRKNTTRTNTTTSVPTWLYKPATTISLFNLCSKALEQTKKTTATGMSPYSKNGYLKIWKVDHKPPTTARIEITQIQQAVTSSRTSVLYRTPFRSI